ncbi:LADA_0C03642g1_1 [Lachancea dasiensis]|uniref:SWI5-dependent HO expression protein 3 n=1 Tax=Lachancea dasiensis TaxID=1072105 RepID=A0A1G4IZ07_9SACH|nr:LADA_0C03642g1_1 [Lachancea dasiensis]
MGSTPDEMLNSRLNSPVKLSPSKLSQNHGTFMANIQNGHSPSRESSYGGSSSTRVIEGLHAQIDNLTRTNLELTVQSNNLLSRLETANAAHSKHLETISTLKHENENLNTMLSRKERRLRDVEEQQTHLQRKYEEAASENQSMSSQLQGYTKRETTLGQQLEQVQVQYDALLDGQSRQREKYAREIEELRAGLERFKEDHQLHLKETLKTFTDSNAVLNTRLEEYSQKSHLMASLEQEKRQLLNNECDELRAQLDVQKWEHLYREYRKTMHDYTQNHHTESPTSFSDQHGHDTSRSASRSPLPSQSSTSGVFSNPAHLGGPASSSNPQHIRIPKTRNSSSSSVKRSSFYGTNVTVASSSIPGLRQSSSSSTHMTPPGSLPGVKRSTSIRSTMHSSRNSSGETPTVDINASISKSHPKPFSGYKKKRTPSQTSYKTSDNLAFESQ